MQPQQPNSNRLVNRIPAGLCTAAVLALAAGALAFLGSDLLGSLVLSGSSPAVASWQSPIAFDASAQEVARLKVGEREMGRSLATVPIQVAGDVVSLDDWHYTAIVRGRPRPSCYK